MTAEDSTAKRKAAYYAANKDKYRLRAAAYYAKNRDAYRERSLRWLKENSDRAREWYAQYYLINKEKYRERERLSVAKDRNKYNVRKAAERAVNPESVKAAFVKWRAQNLDVIAHHNGLRRSRKMQATPAWADLTAIKAFYKEAATLRKQTGTKWHVDHVIPLKHPLVCGLHVAANLQVIPGAENQSKGNRLVA